MPKSLSYHLHFPVFAVGKSEELRKLYGIRLLREISNKLVVFFLPLFIFQQGEKLAPILDISVFKAGMILIAAYYLVNRLVMLATAITVGKVIHKYGFAFSFVIAHLLYALTCVMFFYSMQWFWLLIIIGMVDGLQSNFFWNSYHTVFSKQIQNGFFGRNLGLVQFFINLITAFSPAIGGYLIFTFDYGIVFFVGIVMSLIGVIVASSLQTARDRDRVSWKEFYSWISERAYQRLAVSFAGRYMNDVGITLWPLYVLLLLGSVASVGYLYSLSLFISLVISYFVGYYIDKYQKPHFYQISGWLLTVLWFFRTQVINPFSIAMVDLADRLTASFHWIVFDKKFFMRGKGREALSFFVYREMLISLAAIFFWGVFFLIFVISPLGWQGLFIMAAVGVLLSLLIRENKVI